MIQVKLDQIDCLIKAHSVKHPQISDAHQYWLRYLPVMARQCPRKGIAGLVDDRLKAIQAL